MRKAPLFVGVDVGTYETKGVVTTGDGRLVAQASQSHQVDVGPGGRVEHDALRVWWAGLRDVVRQLTSHPDVDPVRLEALACSGIGPCVLPVGRDLEPLGPAALYGVDTRSGDEVTQICQRLGPEVIWQRSANQLSSQSAGPKILWLARNEPEVHRKARWFLTSQSFLVARLTGEVVIDHATASFFHPLYAIGKGRWELAGCEDFIDLDRLPRIAWAGELAGSVTVDAAGQTGLPAGLPVLVGTADAQAEAFGSGVVESSELMVMYGSSSFMIQVRDELGSDPLAWNAPYLLPGRWAAAAGTSTAGTVTRWLVDLLGLPAGPAGFEQLVQLARQSRPGADGLLFLPHLAGERTPWYDDQARGVFAGLSLGHGRAQLARAGLEGVAHSMVAALQVLTANGAPSRVAAVGGGTRNAVWLQAVSDIADLAQSVVEHPGAAYGGAALAALWATPDAAPTLVRDWLPAERVVSPRAEHVARYQADQQRFVELYRAVQRVPASAPTVANEPGTGGLR